MRKLPQMPPEPRSEKGLLGQIPRNSRMQGETKNIFGSFLKFFEKISKILLTNLKN